jgi:polar amino acid transport system substrate-binding protein
MLSYLKTTLLILLINIYFVIGPTYAAEVELLVMTEEFPPFNYQKDNVINGLATKIVIKLLEEAHLTFKIELVPWKRALNTALNRPNTLIYTIAKSESRKDKFHWICKISNRKLSMFRLRSRQDLENMTIEEAKEKAKIAVLQGDASTEKVINMGFPIKNLTMIRDISGGNLSIKHVMRGRSDFFLMNPYSMKHRINSGDIPDLFTEQFVIHNDDGYYIAANLGTEPFVLKALRNAYKRLAGTGFINKIVSEYLTF